MSPLRRHYMALIETVRQLEPGPRARLLASLPDAAFRGLAEEWWWQAHGAQREPEGGWRVWMILAGRGFGKTRAGAEWVWDRARECPEARIALVGATVDEVSRVMIEGDSGILSIGRSGEEAKWGRTKREIVFPSGATAFAYSGANPDALRGPQHHFAWCDELAKWRRARATWDNLEMGMRLGERPRIVATTTPGRTMMFKELTALDDTIATHGRTIENEHLPAAFVEAMTRIYGGTSLGRQELDGELMEDAEGTLWPRALIERCRAPMPHPPGDEEWERVLVGVDPPASSKGRCGIVVAGLAQDGIAYVLADCTVEGQRPDGWARAAARAAEAWGADRIIAENNQGGDMVTDVIRGVAPELRVVPARASRSKTARAEPVAMAFESGRAKFAGSFPALEDELNAMIQGGAYEGAERSPDRADAMVWAMDALVVKPRPMPRVRRL